MPKIKLLILAALTLFATTGFADNQVNTTDTMVNTTMHNLMQKYAIPGAAVILYKDGTMHQYYYGVTKTKSNNKVDNKTIFELGSISKTFTALLLAQQVNSGKMQLDDKVTSYLDNGESTSASMKQITLLELASYTSSLPYNATDIAYNASDSDKNQKALSKFMHTWVAPYIPGTQELYSNLGFSILGMALADPSGNDLSDVIQQNILNPLGMSSSFMTIPENFNQLYSHGYTATGAPSRSPNEGLFGGSWAMKSSSDDMTKYLEASIGLAEAPASIVAAMKTAQTGYFEFPSAKKQVGLAWTMVPLDKVTTAELLKVEPLKPRKVTPNTITRIKSPQYNPHALIEKTGSTNGFRAYIAVIPDQKTGVVILTNRFVYDSNIIQHTGREILLSQ